MPRNAWSCPHTAMGSASGRKTKLLNSLRISLFVLASCRNLGPTKRMIWNRPNECVMRDLRRPLLCMIATRCDRYLYLLGKRAALQKVEGLPEKNVQLGD